MSASTPKLNLPNTNRVKLFRALDQVFRADPQIARVVKVFKSWKGDATDKIEPSIGQLPFVGLAMRGGPQAFWASSTMSGLLMIDVTIATAGTCLDDMDNLWGLFERACYPADATVRLALQARLRAIGAHTGLLKFEQPAFDADPEGAYLIGTGGLSIEYRFDQNPSAPGF